MWGFQVNDWGSRIRPMHASPKPMSNLVIARLAAEICPIRLTRKARNDARALISRPFGPRHPPQGGSETSQAPSRRTFLWRKRPATELSLRREAPTSLGPAQRLMTRVSSYSARARSFALAPEASLGFFCFAVTREEVSRSLKARIGHGEGPSREIFGTRFSLKEAWGARWGPFFHRP